MSLKPILTFDEIKRKKVRVPGSAYSAFWQSCGASPVTTAWSELYTSLSQKVIDACEAPLATLYASSLQEVAKDVTLTAHAIPPCGFYMNAKIFRSLSPEYQTILREEAKNVGIAYTEYSALTEAEWKQKMQDAGVIWHEFSEADRAKMKQAAADMYKMFPELSEGLYENIRQAVSE
jgi:TRAP-type C4-dicarboxylate transport system substrate-binding protein